MTKKQTEEQKMYRRKGAGGQTKIFKETVKGTNKES